MKCIAGIIFAFLCISLVSRALAQAQVEYSVRVTGIMDANLSTLVRNASETVTRQDKPPASIALLRKRVQTDVPRIRQVLAGGGYYGATVNPAINEESRPVRIVFAVNLGPQYTVAQAEIVPAAGTQDVTSHLPTLAKLGLIPAQPATTASILSIKNNIVTSLRRKGYPFPMVPNPEVDVDHATHTVHVTYRVDPGPHGRFAEPILQGNKTVNEHFLRNRIPWKEGDPFNADLLEEARKNLADTQLFSTVTVIPGGHVTETGLVPVTVNLTERPPRTIKAGLSYSTDKGAGAHVSWENRNLFHSGERLELRGLVSQQETSVQSIYTVPDFYHRNQTLKLTGRIAAEDTDAYKGDIASVEADVERKLSKKLTLGGGVALRASNVKQESKRNTFFLLAFPGYLSWDTRDNVLDPARGGLLTLRMVPTIDLAHTDANYLRTLLGYNQHFKLYSNPRIILATRVALGSIVGADRDEVPPDDRFYAGGGGSVRGYGYQMVGPLDRKHKPIGGRSLLEFSTEFRVKVKDYLGLVTFLDGGGVFPNETAQINSTIMFGAGVGVRYFSPVGPFRVDLAFPLNRRHGIDNLFEIYLSMGQAF